MTAPSIDRIPSARGTEAPWYAQFWPWFLITLLASVVIASFMLLYIANRHSDDLVVDEYYKTGLAINRELEDIQRAEALGISARLIFSPERVEIETKGPVSDPELKLQLSHPLEADQDFSVTLQRRQNGVYSAVLKREVFQRWHWKLQSPENGGWRLDGVLADEDFAYVRSP